MDEVRRTVATRVLSEPAEGTKRPNEGWGNCPQGMAVETMLDMDPAVIVDVRPVSGAEFLQTHGCTPSELAELSRQGLAILNLLAFDSDKQEGFAKHQVHFEVIEPLLEPSVGCRINAVRRRRFFDLLGLAAKNEATSEGRGLFRTPVDDLSDQERVALLGEPTSHEALQKVSENWSYLVVLASHRPTVAGWIDLTRRHPPRSPADTQVVLGQLAMFKSLFATPFTATFGGTHNLSRRELGLLYDSAVSLRAVAAHEDLSDLAPGTADIVSQLCELPRSLGAWSQSSLPFEERLRARLTLVPLLRRKAAAFARISRTQGDIGVQSLAVRQHAELQRELVEAKRELGYVFRGDAPSVADRSLHDVAAVRIPAGDNVCVLAITQNGAILGETHGSTDAQLDDVLSQAPRRAPVIPIDFWRERLRPGS